MPNNRKRVLIITYYWPPSGGSGVQRWVKFVKYLRDFGWEPIIYTASNPEFPEIDKTLETDIPDGIEIIKQPIWEPYQLYKKFVGLKPDSRLKTGLVQENANPSLPKKISVWIRGNFFIPDARRFWIKPSIKFLSNYLKRDPVDVIVTNGTPHSLHLIGLGLKKKFGLPWLADFRDPWTNIDFFDDLLLTPWAKKKHYKQEQTVLEKADCVTVTTPGTKADFLKQYPDSRIEVITNGFDSSDFKDIKTKPDSAFVMAHIGALAPSRNHPFFWDCLKELADENPDFAQNFKLNLVGSVDSSIWTEIENRSLNNLIEHIGYLPHSEIPIILRRARVLLLKISDSKNKHTVIPGKIFEYIASGRPVISIGPVGSDSDQILRDSSSGQTFSEKNKNELKKEILSHFDDFKSGKLPSISVNELNKYSRKQLTERLSNILNNMSEL